jgi:hypothetical protein
MVAEEGEEFTALREERRKLHTEDTEDGTQRTRKRVKSGNFVALDRKSPPFAKNKTAKDGAP